MPRAYLDHASSSPLRPAAFDAMVPFLQEHHADPGRVHSEGRITRVAIENAREQIARLVGARPREVMFTSSGTEAVNSAVWGAARGHVVSTAVEHSSVLDAVRRSGVEHTIVGVDAFGRVDADAMIDALRADTRLVNVQLANHEVGTVQPVDEIIAASRARGVLVHVDACMAIGHLDVDFRALDADLCSVTAHKLGGPKGVGALLIRRGLRLDPLIVGGAQERARRGGIENVPAIVGFGAAVEVMDLTGEAAPAQALTERIAKDIAGIEGVERFGDPVRRVPHIVCFGVTGVEAEPILLALDQRGVAVHSGSACSSETLEPSPVLHAMGVDADHSVRVSVGWNTTETEVDQFLDALPEVIAQLRSLRW